MRHPHILTFSQIQKHHTSLVGGKNASLGLLFNHIRKQGVNVPDGFVVTIHAYRALLIENKIEQELYSVLCSVDASDLSNLKKKGKQARELILRANFSEEIQEEIKAAYQQLSERYKTSNLDVAVRSSATAEDLPTASFAGQQESFLNIRGEQALLRAVKKCMASLFTDRAISYRIDKGFSHKKVLISVSVQKMVRSDRASAGVLFTLDTESGFRNITRVNSSYGLGEYVVKGVVVPDEFIVFKPTGSIISKQLGRKLVRLVYGKGSTTRRELVPIRQQKRFSLTDKEGLQLARWGEIIEDYYKTPMDIEWAKDGRENKLYVVQARPETVHAPREEKIFIQYKLKEKGKVVVTGESIGEKIGTGPVKIIKNISQIYKVKEGDVLVTEMTDPDWEPIMKRTSAIVTQSGGRTCHAAIVSRELGIPCVVGAEEALHKLRSVQRATVDCSRGETGFIYGKEIPFAIKKTKVEKIELPKRPDIMMNLGDPTSAFKYSFLPNKGIGLARQEFIVTSFIKIHPLALIHYRSLDTSIKNKINSLTKGYSDKKQFYIDQLTYGIAKIAAAFHPHDVILRFSDFKTNEYKHLIGGEAFEPVEANPMLGWRGASRYYDPKFRSAFGLECAAIKKVRNDMGLRNLKVMVPFCRTPAEGRKVLKIMRENGLSQGKNELEVYVMIEIPSNIILAEEFADIFDGFSIGSNDLTQLTLGLDRDSPLLSSIGDERHEAVKRSIREVIQVAKKKNIKIGICGQAPSDFPDFTRMLVQERIDSISLTPDSIIPTIMRIKKYVK